MREGEETRGGRGSVEPTNVVVRLLFSNWVCAVCIALICAWHRPFVPFYVIISALPTPSPPTPHPFCPLLLALKNAVSWLRGSTHTHAHTHTCGIGMACKLYVKLSLLLRPWPTQQPQRQHRASSAQQVCAKTKTKATATKRTTTTTAATSWQLCWARKNETARDATAKFIWGHSALS